MSPNEISPRSLRLIWSKKCFRGAFLHRKRFSGWICKLSKELLWGLSGRKYGVTILLVSIWLINGGKHSLLTHFLFCICTLKIFGKELSDLVKFKDFEHGCSTETLLSEWIGITKEGTFRCLFRIGRKVGLLFPVFFKFSKGSADFI